MGPRSNAAGIDAQCNPKDSSTDNTPKATQRAPDRIQPAMNFLNIKEKLKFFYSHFAGQACRAPFPKTCIARGSRRSEFPINIEANFFRRNLGSMSPGAQKRTR
jgi:hypothetical protein